ncbi:MAG: ABC transporter substrate-binding protein [Acidobacteriota bacterium]
MKRLSWSLLALGTLASCFCARKEATPAPTAVLSRHLTGDPATLDPTTTTEEAGLLVEELMFRPLVGINGQRRPAPALAVSWTVSPDGLVYEFHLDPKATWDDGTPVTSDDVRFTVERIRDPKIPAMTWRSGFEDLVAIETPDRGTVRFRFRDVYAERLIAFNLPIVSAAAFGRAKTPAETARHPVGSGPYRFDSWESNQKIRLVRRKEATPAEAGFSEVVFRVIPADSVRFQAGSQGQIDEFRISRDQKRAAEATPEFMARNRILKVPQFLQTLVIWNCKTPFLSDVRVRKALALSWPREEAAKRLYPPDGAALITGPYPAGVVEIAPDVPVPHQDLAQSERLLEEAGWKASGKSLRRKAGKTASVELLFPAGSSIYLSIAEILRSAYEKVGVGMTLRPLDWAAFTQRTDAGEFEAQIAGRLFFPPNLDPYPYFHSSQWPPGGPNQGFYKDAEADRVMEAARKELDDAKRLELYRQVHRLLAADPPADFLWGTDQYWAIAKRVDGVTVSPLGLFHFLPGPLGWIPAPAKAP